MILFADLVFCLQFYSILVKCLWKEKRYANKCDIIIIVNIVWWS